MNENIKNKSDLISKQDLETILQVNKKSIEIETEVANQNEEILETLAKNESLIQSIDSKIEKKLEKINLELEKNKENNIKIFENFTNINKSLFEIKVLFGVGAISIILQIIQFLVNYKK